MRTYSSEGPPLLPDDSEDNPPSLPPPDRHDDYDHIFAGQRQQMAMDSDMVSEARPISDDSDIDRTIVSAMPSLDDSSIDSDFSEPTLVEAIDGSSSSTTVGFRRGQYNYAPKDENTSKSLVSDLDTSSSEALSESDLLEGPSVERLEQAFQSNDNKVACSIFGDVRPDLHLFKMACTTFGESIKTHGRG